MSKSNVDAYFNELHRKACILQAMVHVISDRYDERFDDDRDFVIDNMLDAARGVSNQLSAMALEDPEHWEARS